MRWPPPMSSLGLLPETTEQLSRELPEFRVLGRKWSKGFEFRKLFRRISISHTTQWKDARSGKFMPFVVLSTQYIAVQHCAMSSSFALYFHPRIAKAGWDEWAASRGTARISSLRSQVVQRISISHTTQWKDARSGKFMPFVVLSTHYNIAQCPVVLHYISIQGLPKPAGTNEQLPGELPEFRVLGRKWSKGFQFHTLHNEKPGFASSFLLLFWARSTTLHNVQ